MDSLLIKLIQNLDKNIHPKRIGTIRYYLNYLFIIAGLLSITVTVGVFGFMFIEKFNFVDAFYMTIITVSTVGFGEIRPLTSSGRIFASFLILSNIGIFAYSISNLASFIISGEYKQIVKDLMIGRKIDKMKNHIIVCGYGRYGRSVVEHLVNQKIPCVLIEQNLEKIDKIRKNKEVIVLDGDATDENTLQEAGISSARALITTLPKDSSNVYTILSARHLNPSLRIISRANEASSKKNLIKAGANEVLIPENIGGFYMSALITKPDIIQAFSEMSSLENSSFRMAEIIIEVVPNHLEGKTIADLKLEEKAGVKIIGTKHQEDSFKVNPPLSTPILQNTKVLVIGNQEQIGKFHEITTEFYYIE